MECFDDAHSIFFEDGDVCFYDDAPSPSDEIWKKFELLPTPPRSQRDSFNRDKPMLGECVTGTCQGSESFLTRTCIQEPFCGVCDGNLKSKLIQDCMWSAGNGFHFDSEKNSPGAKRTFASKTETEMGTAAQNAANSPKSSTGSVSSTNTGTTGTSLDIPRSECVDPVAVFPYPVNKQLSHQTGRSTEAPSDSEDDEIDVVTVSAAERSRHNHHSQHQSSGVSQRTILPASSSISAQVAAMHNYSSSRSSVVMRSAPQSPAHHSQRVKRAYASSPSSPQPIIKRHRSGVDEAELRFAVQKLEMRQVACSYGHGGSADSSRPSSDSEDNEGKRAQHNVLERKRRNDLKYSFLRLRDVVPQIATQNKAAKVTILRRAVDHMAQLKSQHMMLLTELEKQKTLHEQLKRKLSELFE